MSQLPLEIAQKWMQEVLIRPLGHSSSPAEILPKEVQGDIEKVIAPNSRMSGRERLAIYQRGYLARLRECMAKQFTALQVALGEALFQNFADEYLQTYPSESYTLNDLGKHFARFLQETRPDRDLPRDQQESWPNFLIELAEFEFAINQVFDGHFDTDFEYATLETPDDQLALVDSLQLFAFQFPVNQYYQQAIKGKVVDLPFPEVSHTAILRKINYQVGLIDIHPSQHEFLKLWRSSTDFATAKAAFLEKIEKSEPQFDNIWQQWKSYFVEHAFLSVVKL